MFRALTAVVLVAAVSTAGGDAARSTRPDPALVKTVRDLTTSGVKEFEAGNPTKAIDLLQQAISVIQKSLAGNLAAFLPAPPEGWEAGKIEQQSLTATGGAMAQWTQVSRYYTRKKDRQKVTILLSNSPSIVNIQKTIWQSYQNPMILAMLNKDPNVQVSIVKDREGWSGYTTVEKGKSAKAVLFITGCLLTVETPGDGMALVEQFLGLMDLKAMAKALATSTSPGGKAAP